MLFSMSVRPLYEPKVEPFCVFSESSMIMPFPSVNPQLNAMAGTY
jgi:hypothetical protein